jgi:excisionase family DNA binding protein
MRMDRISVRVPDALQMTGMKRSTFYRELSAGNIPSFRVGSVRLIPVDGLRRWVDQQAETQAPSER